MTAIFAVRFAVRASRARGVLRKMPKRVQPLTNSQVSAAKAKAVAYDIRDGLGLYLRVTTSGGKLWRLDYPRPRTHKRNTLSLGAYPAVTLARARERRDEARRLLADGVDPSEQRKATAAGATDTFESIAREWYATRKDSWVPAHGDRILRRLERNVFPWIGAKPVTDLTAPDVLAAVRRVEAAGHGETAHRTLSNIGQVLRYAIATGRATVDVTNRMSEALAPVAERHLAAVLNPDQLGDLLRDIDAYTGTLPVRTALRLAPLVFLRPSELRNAEWPEFDLDKGEWNIPPSRRKLKKARKNDPQTPSHLVPLSKQAVAILRELEPLTQKGRFVFPGTRDPHRPLSDMSLLGALRRMGYDKDTMTTHGWRAVARTLLAETLHFPIHIIEHQLDHRVIDPNGRAYNRTTYLAERKQMMQAWADYLDELRTESLQRARSLTQTQAADDSLRLRTPPVAKASRRRALAKGAER